ncbi:L-glutamate gamma-semialdehyde dehydrogenase [Deinococcus peraridilitoris]|uniref:L-glutamate gamma-semialdehyde dehydrogenase n=1 Tax=Deinococcus peraridilitoris (strain DSM 19664 / LMG 22246 / CIP 109416 / KR-200) TaxID=937777 RepID=L0A2Z0_DEIPD|nr:L-glutamate gamma-semialdehyde dehydrogenase [Deinococcus peraridilitoris]AFZ68253.1 delta-1-pyrroline-5-carboxylate dehydrogenase, group 2, putative [Deinococcus peraridilitoris DSM 19664]
MLKLPPYKNEPFTDFSLPENQSAYREALAYVRSTFGRTYPLVIGSERIETPEKIASVNPSKTSEVIGYTAKARIEDAEKALQVGWDAWQEWKNWSMDARARVLVKAAALLRRRKHQFSALLTLEAGKNWAEADGDTAEAIDFLEYYARQSMKYATAGETYDFPNEENRLQHIPLGVGVSISPWNFPLAIFAGMLAAPIVVGNCVIAKPAEDTGLIAAWIVDLLHEAGLPAGVLTFLPGLGEEVGDYLVKHPKTRFVTFTGSRQVGLMINENAAKVPRGQKWIKRVVLEMGGKDALIVDETADLEEAASAAVASAFGFSGQKCSAMSRLIVVDSVHDELVRRVVEKTKALKVGSGEENAHVTPVVNEESFEKVSRYIEMGKSEGKLLTGGGVDGSVGHFIEPTIFDDVQSGAKIAEEEIFGPVVAVLCARDFDHALELANDTEYGLTGGVFTKKRERIEKARMEFQVGNLYINRKITGALVGVQPFGGFNMSGTDSKAGGPNYLDYFLQLKTVAERF